MKRKANKQWMWIAIEAYTGVSPTERHKAITKQARKTNHIERFNNTLRRRVAHLVRETLSFSKKLANPIGALKYFICYYNLTKATVRHSLCSIPWCEP